MDVEISITVRHTEFDEPLEESGVSSGKGLAVESTELAVIMKKIRIALQTVGYGNESIDKYIDVDGNIK